jgi:hypothetical protein
MLYFAYAGLMDPDRLRAVAPHARFRFIAHLPETRLCFPVKAGLPSMVAEPGHTVWGAVFDVSPAEAKMIAAAEGDEGRVASMQKAVDREGNKYEVVTYVVEAGGNEQYQPNPAYMEAVVQGARHWSLPTGWIVGLEEYGEDLMA